MVHYISFLGNYLKLPNTSLLDICPEFFFWRWCFLLAFGCLAIRHKTAGSGHSIVTQPWATELVSKIFAMAVCWEHRDASLILGVEQHCCSPSQFVEWLCKCPSRFVLRHIQIRRWETEVPSWDHLKRISFDDRQIPRQRTSRYQTNLPLLQKLPNQLNPLWSHEVSFGFLLP